MTGDGSFGVAINNKPSNKLGCQVLLEFNITQHSRDIELLKSFVDYLDCGRYKSRSGYEAGSFVVTRLSDITSPPTFFV